MRILVVVTEWEQACCGTRFRVGDEATWNLSAGDPALLPADGLPRFIEERHGQTAPEVPHWSVTGTVRAITGVTYPQLPVTGEPRSFAPDTDRPALTVLSEVAGGASTDFFEYFVEFDVADDCALPSFVVSDWEREQRQTAAQDAVRNRARMKNPTDGIGIHTGDGSWWLPATVESAALARVFLDAAVSGRVVEEVIDVDGGHSTDLRMIERSSLADLLMRGPRGRRLSLEYAIASERLHDPECREDSFSAAVFLASYHLDPGKGTSVQLFGDVPAEIPVVTATDVAERLASVPLAAATPVLLRDCLAETVASARYWQEADGSDVLAVTDELQTPLRRVAEHIAASAHAAWWGEPVAECSQWQVEWDDAPPHEIMADPVVSLHEVRDQILEEELVARRERPSDVTANWSGTWWSRPPGELPSTTRVLFDGGPAGLWFVEDSLGWEQADTRWLGMPAGLRIYEIDTAGAWADLYARFPIAVTAQKRHDWYRTTGRDGAWVIPDLLVHTEHALHRRPRAVDA